MVFAILRLSEFAGEKTQIYSPIIENDTNSLYDKFVLENCDEFENEVLDIDTRLEIVAKETGLMAESFKSDSGKFGENLCTFKDLPRRKLRLFFIQFGLKAIILGGGGKKPRTVRATQDDPKLWEENRLLGLISICLQEAEKKGQFTINVDGTFSSTTNFIYNTDNYAKTKGKR